MDTAKLFVTGRSQAVRLPKAYRFEGTEVFIRKEGKAGDHRAEIEAALAAGFFQKDTDQRPRISAARSRQSSASVEFPRICLAPKGAIHFKPGASPRDLWIKIRESAESAIHD